MDDQNLFTIVDREFFDTISRYPITPTYVDHLRELLPEEWTLSRSGTWVMASNGIPGPRQGFKIHVSSIPPHALRTLELVVPECTRRGIVFKIAADPALLNFLNSKRYGRGGSGKFMTIYPQSSELFCELIEAMHRATAGTELVGPYILSDRRYKDSKIIFYRYGGFARIDHLQPDGSSEPVILSPDNEPVRDDRLPYFELPPWVSDPFGAEPAPPEQNPTILNGRYAIDGVIGFSNTGGVYYGTDTRTGSEVILKEARPNTAHWSIDGLGFDAVALLEREHRILCRLWPTRMVPEPLDRFQQWEHTFLVETRVPGITLQQFWARETTILAPYIHHPGRIEQFIPVFRRVTRALIDLVESVHREGVILGDLSPNNVLIDPEELTLKLIDFESAVIVSDDGAFMRFSRRWVTPGFENPERANRPDLRKEDDLYALAMLLYGSVVPVQPFFALNRGAKDLFLDHFVRLGVPLQIKHMIDALLQGQIGEARSILDRWEAAERESEPEVSDRPGAAAVPEQQAIPAIAAA